MSVDDWDLEYHLTPSGWKRGSSKFYGKTDDEVPRPPDVVETWNLHAHQSSAFSQEDRTVSLIWHNPTISEEDRKALRSKFPSPFKATDIVR